MPDDEMQQAFERLAKRVRSNTTRPVFEALFDESMADLIDRGVARAMPFKALALDRARKDDKPLEPGVTKDEADIAWALDRASELHLFEMLVKMGFDKLFGIVTTTKEDAQTSEAIRIDFQAIVSRHTPLLDPLATDSGGAAAQRRCCRIACLADDGTRETGSGFLIGPNLILTNRHVVRSQLGADGKPAEHSRERMTITFDALGGPDINRRAYRPSADWLVIDDAEPPAIWPDDPDTLTGCLDFAIVALDATPGRERGWYDLNAARWPQPGTGVDVYQFPAGMKMSHSQGRFVEPPPRRMGQPMFSNPRQPPRLFYDANAIPGSSGGVCLDPDMQALALHHGAYSFVVGKDNSGQPVVITLNAAIPLALIAQKAGALVQKRNDQAPPVETWTDLSHPIIGRRLLQSLIAPTSTGTNRIIVVQTSLDPATRTTRPKIGKSFSTDILKRHLPASEHVILTVRGLRLTTDARECARVIMEAIDPGGTRDLPLAAGRQVPVDPDATERLVSPLIEAMRRAAGNGCFWLLIDDLDKYPVIIGSTAANLLDRLFAAIAADNQLRLVLIGPTSRPDALASLPASFDILDSYVVDEDIEDWIGVEYGSKRTLAVDVIKLIARMVRSVAAKAGEDPLVGPTAAVAAVLRDHLKPAFQPPARGSQT